nr:MAG TPA: hypothetical protein [Caudoviricetes sp.]
MIRQNTLTAQSISLLCRKLPLSTKEKLNVQ